MALRYCIQQGTTGELNLADYTRASKIEIKPVAFATSTEAANAFVSGRCDAWTTDISALSANKLRFPNPDDFVVLPEVISKEPLGAWVRQGDDQWFDIVRWTLFAMQNAEELGVTQANVDEMLKSTNPEIKRLLGVEGNSANSLASRTIGSCASSRLSATMARATSGIWFRKPSRHPPRPE